MKKKIVYIILVFIVLLLVSTIYKKVFDDSFRDMVFIPGGKFTMGSDKPPHAKNESLVMSDEVPSAAIDLIGFYIDKYEVTNGRYRRFINATDRKSTPVDPVDNDAPYNWKDGNFPDGEESHPAVLVNWEDANAYCRWRNKRLPTEAEWEKACRGEEARRWSFGNDFEASYANTKEQKFGWSRPVGSFPKDVSSYGAFDMSGNIMEWTGSWYLAYPGAQLRKKSFGKKNKVIRGGGWLTGSGVARCSNRTQAPPTKKHRAVGFRCAKDMR